MELLNSSTIENYLIAGIDHKIEVQITNNVITKCAVTTTRKGVENQQLFSEKEIRDISRAFINLINHVDKKRGVDNVQ